jgi:hypothetical protein
VASLSFRLKTQNGGWRIDATPLLESPRPQSSCGPAGAPGISAAPSQACCFVLKGFDSDVNSVLTYLKSSHCSMILGISDLWHSSSLSLQPCVFRPCRGENTDVCVFPKRESTRWKSVRPLSTDTIGKSNLLKNEEPQIQRKHNFEISRSLLARPRYPFSCCSQCVANKPGFRLPATASCSRALSQKPLFC